MSVPNTPPPVPPPIPPAVPPVAPPAGQPQGGNLPGGSVGPGYPAAGYPPGGYPPGYPSPSYPPAGYGVYGYSPVEPNEGRLRWATWSFFALVAFNCLNILMSILGLVTPRVDDGEGNLMSPLWLAGLSALVGLGNLIIYICTIVFFLRWMSRAHRTLPVLGATNLKFTHGWVIGWWFIPFANLVKPFQAMKEIFLLSDPKSAYRDGESAQKGSTPGILPIWWALWILTNVVSNVSMRIQMRATTEAALNAGLVIDIVADCLSIAAAICVLRIMQTVTRHQRERLSGTIAAPQMT